MVILTYFHKYGLWLSWPVFGLGVFLLWFFIMSVVKVGEKHRICHLPLQAEQMVEFAEAGRVILWLEGPLLTNRFAGLSFELRGPDGSSSKGRMALFRGGSSSFSKARIADRVFTITTPGRYVLHTEGLGGEKAGDEQHRLIFMRPYLAETVGSVLGIILGAVLTIGSTVNFLIRLLGGGGQ